MTVLFSKTKALGVMIVVIIIYRLARSLNRINVSIFFIEYNKHDYNYDNMSSNAKTK